MNEEDAESWLRLLVVLGAACLVVMFGAFAARTVMLLVFG